jgi:hypothetical protein
MKFDLKRICYLLYQADARTMYGKGIMNIMQSANREGLYVLLAELQELLESWPEVLRTVFAPAELEEMKQQLTL